MVAGTEIQSFYLIKKNILLMNLTVFVETSPTLFPHEHGEVIGSHVLPVYPRAAAVAIQVAYHH